LVSPSNTRPPSRADRRLRFAELDANDVHVYESAPPSPKRRVLALPPPDPKAKDTISLGQWKGKMVPDSASSQPAIDQPLESSDNLDTVRPDDDLEPEEGTTEYIRRRFFPDEPKDDPNLAWLQESPKPDSSSPSLRFDLHGNLIPASTSLNLPTHLGLHHHAEGTHAGYTLDDIFLLSRSTVPAQRATMLGILARIAHRLPDLQKGESTGTEQLIGMKEELRKRMLAAGVEALSGRGNTGVRAIEIVWECVVGWRPSCDMEGVELELLQERVIDDLPFDFLLPQVETILSQGANPPESQLQLLSVLHRLSQQSNVIANKIASTPKLLPTILQKFLLVPISPQEPSPLPDPLALQIFYTLVLASRTNAEEVGKLADTFLRFVAFLPQSSPYPFPLAINLLIWTLRIYRALAAYGLYTEIASVAVTPLVQLEQYIVSKVCTSIPLRLAWSNLVATWMTCAIDPHQTTPAHSIKWSQIMGWRWDTCIFELQDQLGLDEGESALWAATWRVQAAWLEGSKVNAVKGGEAERNDFIEIAKQHFQAGRATQVIVTALDRIQQLCVDFSNFDDQIVQLKAISNNALVLSSVLRLWMACLPPHLNGPPPAPPFPLPFSQLSELTARLVTHPLWSFLDKADDSFGYFYCREISEFLGFYLRLSQRLPGVTEKLFAAQACAIVLRLGPGEEATAEAAIRDLTKLVTPYWLDTQGNQAPQISKDTDILSILEPYMHHKLHPDPDLCIGPLTITMKSIQAATTLRLPSPASMKKMGLPLHRDWTLSPIDDLLRSGESEVFKAFPSSLGVSEVETTRVCLVLTKLVQDTLNEHSLHTLVLSKEEAIFRCLQIFMLEHGQPQNDSTEEVYRDAIIGRLMENILQVYMFGQKPPIPSSSNEEDIELVAARFLGFSVPFFQFYTDFVDLYDSVSFSHSLFANLLLPPTSMKYAQDYRKHLWCDFGHILRTVQTSPETIISADLREYLYPAETNPQIINAYLSSLLKDDIQEFPKFLAVHHLACNVWPDLVRAEELDEQKASAILKVVLQQGRNDLIRSLVRYRQNSGGAVLLPPKCFEGLDEQTAGSRKGCVSRWGGSKLHNKIDSLLN